MSSVRAGRVPGAVRSQVPHPAAPLTSDPRPEPRRPDTAPWIPECPRRRGAEPRPQGTPAPGTSSSSDSVGPRNEKVVLRDPSL